MKPKFKGIIHNSNVGFDNIYRSTVKGVVNYAKKELDIFRSTHGNGVNTLNAIIKVYEGELRPTPAYMKKQTVFYTKIVHEETY